MRSFVLVEGAFLLMSEGHFTSFRQGAVLQGLRRFRRWRPLVRQAEAVLADPLEAAVPPDDVLAGLAPFVE